MSSSDPGSVELDNIKDATLDMNVRVKGRVCNISKGSVLHGMFHDNTQKQGLTLELYVFFLQQMLLSLL